MTLKELHTLIDANAAQDDINYAVLYAISLGQVDDPQKFAEIALKSTMVDVAV